MRAIKAGDTVAIYGYLCKVIGVGTCEDDACERPTVTIIDPAGMEDTLHEDECDGAGH